LAGDLHAKMASAVAFLRSAYGNPQAGAGGNPVDCLVAVMLSQNTTGGNSSRAYRSLRERFARWEDVLAAPESEVAETIRPAGLGQIRAHRIREILLRIRREHGRVSLACLSRMDDRRAMEYLRSFPGVGPKTAACVLGFSLGRDVFPVDTHVRRIAWRLGLVERQASTAAVQNTLAAITPPGECVSAHLLFIRHGRQVCRARRPACHRCAVIGLCERCEAACEPAASAR